MIGPALLRASIDGAVVVAVVWALCRFVPLLPAAARAMLWWCAAAKFVVALLWATPVTLAILPALEGTHEQTLAGTAAPQDDATPIGSSGLVPADVTRGLWSAAVAAIWSVGVGISLLAGIRQWRRAHHFVRDAEPAPPAVEALVTELSDHAGLPAPPAVRFSATVGTPIVVGFRRSTIVLPEAAFMALTLEEQRMTISHELAHIVRADLRWGAVPAIAEALFFFHPLAHLAAREYATWREAACDAAVIESTHAAPEDYARLLLGLGVTRPRAGFSAAGASQSFSSLKRRLVMLHASPSRTRSTQALAAVIVGLAALAIIPVELTARPADQRASTQGQTLKNDPSSLTYVLFRGDSTHLMDGSSDDIRRAQEHRKGNEMMLWIRRDGREYISRDATLLRQFDELWAPVRSIGESQRKIGERQGVLGQQQGDIGHKQSQIGLEQARIGVMQSEIGLRQNALSLRDARARSDADRAAVEKEHRQLDADMRALDRQMNELSMRMRDLGRPIDDLSARLAELSKGMDIFSRQMRDASERAETEARALIDRAIANGAAVPVK